MLTAEACHHLLLRSNAFEEERDAVCEEGEYKIDVREARHVLAQCYFVHINSLDSRYVSPETRTKCGALAADVEKSWVAKVAKGVAEDRAVADKAKAPK